MQKLSPISLLLAFGMFLSSCATHPVPTGNEWYHGKPVFTRSSHPAGGGGGRLPENAVYLGRRYFTPPGTKTGLQWVDVYGSP